MPVFGTLYFLMKNNDLKDAMTHSIVHDSIEVFQKNEK